MRTLRRIAAGALLSSCLAIVVTAQGVAAQPPDSLICQFEKIATAELNHGQIAAGSEADKGEIVISALNSPDPMGSGNVGSSRLRVLARSSDAVWLAEVAPDAVRGVITVFFKSGIVMYTKHEILDTVNGSMPFGFVEIGRCRALR